MHELGFCCEVTRVRSIAFSVGLVCALMSGLGSSPQVMAQDASGATAGAPADALVADVPPQERPSSADATEDQAAATDETGPEWDAYHHAFELVVSGSRAEALSILRRLAADSPNQPAGVLARHLLEQAGPAGGLEAPRQTGVVPPAPVAAVDAELVPHRVSADSEDAFDVRRGPTKLARAELIGVQTALGIGLGVETCVLLNCSGTRSWAFAPVAGAGLSLGLSVLGTRHGIRPATAAAVNMGSLWGAFHGYALTATLGDLYSDTYYRDPGLSSGDELSLGMFLGQVGGAGIGYALDRLIQPTAGDVSLAGSGALWSTVLSLYIGLTVRQGSFGTHVRYLHWGLMAAADLGMVLGGLVARVQPMSRGRILLIDVGAGLGMGLGTGLAFLIGGNGVTMSGVFGTGTLGLIGGAALSYWITRDWDAPDLPVTVGFAPVEGGATATLGGTF